MMLSNPLELGEDDLTPLQYFHVYLILSLLTVILYAIRTWWILTTGLRAAKQIYSRLVIRILGATIKFFDTTPVGRIINRLSRDTKVIDEAIVDRVNYFLLEVVWVIGIIFAVALNIP
jgi:ABC-type multidrug transport system fused ATPase/permease subunit